jgi:SAM-dependent methyltransferase
MTSTATSYVGGELQLFAQARNWKHYWGETIREFIRGAVLEVGAGIGGTTACLCTGAEPEWLCLEPDSDMAETLRRRIADGGLPANCRVVQGAIADLEPDRMFDAILYVDVLEHIEDDRAELAAASRRLRVGGNLIVLAPAHQFLFSPFDAAIGHYRRYNRDSLTKLKPPGVELLAAFYLDSAGLLASLSNALLLRAGMPTESQIHLWDSYLVPLSRRIDRLLGRSLGKTVIAVWRRGTER